MWGAKLSRKTQLVASESSAMHEWNNVYASTAYVKTAYIDRSARTLAGSNPTVEQVARVGRGGNATWPTGT
jgi:hypothetical protein